MTLFFSGIHRYTKTCSEESIVKQVEKISSSTKEFLFPKLLEVSRVGEREFHPMFRKPNGGWADMRDRQLCLWIAEQEVTSHFDFKFEGKSEINRE